MQEKGVSVFVVVILSIALCTVVSIGAWKYGMLVSEEKIEEQEKLAANQYETIEIDKALANEKIDTLKYILGYVVSDNTNIFKDRINNGEFIKNKDEEFKYVWMLDVMLNKNIVMFNINQNGEEETGITSIDVNDYIVSYKKALGINYLFDQNDLPEGFVYNEANNRIYGATPTSWNIGNIVFKNYFNFILLSVAEEGRRYMICDRDSVSFKLKRKMVEKRKYFGTQIKVSRFKVLNLAFKL